MQKCEDVVRVEFEDRVGNVPVKITAVVETRHVTITKFVDTQTSLRLPWGWATRLTPEDILRIENRAREAVAETAQARVDKKVDPSVEPA